MNNEPVAWMRLTGDRVTRITLEKVQDSDIPLYTHPVKKQEEPNWKEMYWQMHELNHKHWSELKSHAVKEEYESFDRTASHMAGEYIAHPVELTDEEILKLAADNFHYSEYKLVIEFARAILRKAQEK